MLRLIECSRRELQANSLTANASANRNRTAGCQRATNSLNQSTSRVTANEMFYIVKSLKCSEPISVTWKIYAARRASSIKGEHFREGFGTSLVFEVKYCHRFIQILSYRYAVEITFLFRQICGPSFSSLNSEFSSGGWSGPASFGRQINAFFGVVMESCDSTVPQII